MILQEHCHNNCPCETCWVGFHALQVLFDIVCFDTGFPDLNDRSMPLEYPFPSKLFVTHLKATYWSSVFPWRGPLPFCYPSLPRWPHIIFHPGCLPRWYPSTMHNWVYPPWTVVWFDWVPQGIPVVFHCIFSAFEHTKAWYITASWSSAPHSGLLAHLPCASFCKLCDSHIPSWIEHEFHGF